VTTSERASRLPIYDARWFGEHGIGRFAREVFDRLGGFEARTFPGEPWGQMDVLTTSIALKLMRPSFYFTPGFNAPVGCPCPYALTMHDLNHLQPFGQSSGLKRSYYRCILRPAARKAAVVLTVSEFSRSDIIAWAGLSPERVVNVSNGVANCFVSEGPVHSRGNRPYILSIASPKRHKNLVGLLRGFASCRSRNTADLLLIGSEDAETGALIDEQSLRPSVHFLGKVSDEALARLYRGAVALAFVSLYEGFGLPIVEAMACGTPVITSDVGAMSEVAGDCALKVDPRSTQEIGRAIDRLLDSESLRVDLRFRGLNRARLYSWNDTGQRVRKALAPFCLLS
jgi:glycosyltransferase involved in cell wall biosynthesis